MARKGAGGWRSLVARLVRGVPATLPRLSRAGQKVSRRAHNPEDAVRFGGPLPGQPSCAGAPSWQGLSGAYTTRSSRRAQTAPAAPNNWDSPGSPRHRLRNRPSRPPRSCAWGGRPSAPASGGPSLTNRSSDRRRPRRRLLGLERVAARAIPAHGGPYPRHPALAIHLVRRVRRTDVGAGLLDHAAVRAVRTVSGHAVYQSARS